MKYIPHILLTLIVVAVLALFFIGDNDRKERVFDARATFRKNDKIPYGAFVAFRHLRYLFPQAAILAERREPGFWDSLSRFGDKQALIILCPFFNADEEEMKTLVEFAASGNNVFLSTLVMSPEAKRIFQADIFYPLDNPKYTNEDSLTVVLQDEIGSEQRFTYPGEKMAAWFHGVDTSIVKVLGYSENGKPNFIKMQVGNGSFYLQLAPAAFSNYFLLFENNIEYLEKALSHIAPDIRKLVWDEYFLAKRFPNQPPAKDDWLDVFLKYESLRWALLTAIITLAVFVLIEMRRKQRPIPIMARPRNESLDFVKTIGRLYHEKGDHRNLSRKMATYFLEHVRNRYKMPTSKLDADFVKALEIKTNVDAREIYDIVSFINELDHLPSVSQDQLVHFHRQLESFYKKA